MKQKAFTLIEILLALAIISVLAAILLPTIQGLMPNKNKATVLKVVNSISTTTQELLDNPMIYAKARELVTDYNTHKQVEKGLGDLEMSKICSASSDEINELIKDNKSNNCSQYLNYTQKLPNLLYMKLDTTGDYNYMQTGNSRNIVPMPGVYVKVLYNRNDATTNINIRVGDPKNGANKSTWVHTYATDGDSANEFTFTMDRYGKITGNDDLSKSYLENQTNYTK